MAHLTSSPEDKNRWICIYPAYINSKKTVAEGRRIPKDRGVENPTITEIRDVCNSLGLPVAVENTKMYPRDQNRDPTFKGRIRVQMKDKEGSFLSEQFQSRRAIMFHVAETIPKLKSRTQRQGGGDQQSGAQSSGKKKNKKGKK
ncbi:signal recognition particle 19 kDa protein-like [Diadema setosum]|uniref:signal recognition particle 19 kDa protein-like n=1 Tax=Diadema setosum TaxID=31175 RepID=UPI003B3B6CC2